jgi:hypothetical protein
MKRITCSLLLIALGLQPLLCAAQPAPQKTAPKDEPRVEAVAIEELLPAETIAFVATTNLAGLLENFRRLEAFKVMEARLAMLPVAEREGRGTPLFEAVRFLSFGIKDASVLDDTRLGFALFKPGSQPVALPEVETPRAATPGASKQARDTRAPAQTERATGVARRSPGSARTDREAAAASGTREAGSAATGAARAGSEPKVPEPHFVAFVESANLELARQAREQFIAYYSETFSDLGQPEEAKPVKYKGATLERFKNGYVGVMIGATYVLGDLGAMDSIITLRASRDAARLSDNLDFVRARAQLAAPTGLFAYLNGKPAADLLSGFLTKGDVVVGGVLPVGLLNLEGIRSAALSSTFEREGVVDRLVMTLDPTKENLLATLFSGPPVEFGAGRYVPAGTSIFINQSLNLPRLYDDLLVPMLFGSMARLEAYKELEREAQTKGLAPSPERRLSQPGRADVYFAPGAAADESVLKDRAAQIQKEIIARYEKEIGFKFREELGKDLGNEVSLAIGLPPTDPAQTSGDTGFAAFIALRDREATRAALVKLFAYFLADAVRYTEVEGIQPGRTEGERRVVVRPKSEEEIKQQQAQRAAQIAALIAAMPSEIYKQVEMISLSGALAVGLFQDYLVIANSSETIKQLADTPEGGTPITLDPNFRRALTGAPGSLSTQIYLAPKYFDDLLDDFLRAWAAKLPEDAASPISVPATLAATASSDERGIRLEAFSPIGIPAMIAAMMLGGRTQAQAINNESSAAHALRQIAAAERAYAEGHQGRYATLDELARLKTTGFDFARLKGPDQAYRYELKLKGSGAGFEATATPARYGRQGRLSFFIDESGKLRRADKSGEPATAKDEAAPDQNIHERER